jgi:hypothetical protein
MTVSRRRRSFSLRTLFVAVTVLAVPLGWVGYQLNWIRQRHELLERQERFRKLWSEFMKSEEDDSKFDAELLESSASKLMLVVTADPCGKLGAQAPLSLRLFGEIGREAIIFPRGTKKTDKEFQRIKRLFPEAAVSCDDERP